MYQHLELVMIDIEILLVKLIPYMFLQDRVPQILESQCKIVADQSWNEVMGLC